MIKTLFQTALTDVSDKDLEGVGRIRIEDDGRVYRWVQNESTTADIAVGDVLCHTIANGATATQKVKQSATANLNFMAGVAMAIIKANTGTAPKCYGWIQIHGYNAATNVEGTTDILVADNLKAVDAQAYAVKDVAAGTSPSYARGLIALEGFTTNGTGSKKTFIRCLN